MSGKFENSKGKKKKAGGMRILAILAALLVVAAALILLLRPEKREDQPAETWTEETEIRETQAETTEAAQEPTREPLTGKMRIPVRNGMEIVDIGGYTGMYMEDGSDELVSGVLMLKLVNNGEEAVEYATIDLVIGGETAEFSLTTLQPGAAVVLLEKNRMPFNRDLDYTTAEVICENLALFQAPLELHQEELNIQILDGAINVINISEEDIPGTIAIYYKNKAADIYYGGITYRIVLEGGLQAGEVRQMMASHFSDTGSEILFVTIAP